MITTGASVPDELVARFSDPLLQDIYCDALPMKVTNDPAHRTFSDWAIARARWIERGADVSVWLRFGGRQNLGDIGSGPIKATLDGLAVVLGADESRDVDDRVVALVTEQAAPGVPLGCLGVTVAV